MDEAPIVSVPASHQDQVVQQPPQTDIIASSIFTPYAGLAWHDRRAISFQFHPEFAPDYAKALIDPAATACPIPTPRSPRSTAPNDNERVGQWIRNFLHT